jgi:iron complex transport system substrate-binding protein
MARTKDSGHTVRAIGRRSFLAAVGALPLALAACSGDEQAVPAVTPKADAFPVTLRHKFGATTIKSPPLRIVVHGALEADTCAALGLGPVGMPRGDQSPWLQVALNDISAPAPSYFDDGRGVPISEIEKLEPDLILSLTNTLPKANYDALSRLAPVVVPEASAEDGDWRSVVTVIGRALGRQDAATELVRKTETTMKDAVRDYAALKGTSVLYLRASSVAGADVRVFAQASNPMQLAEEFGLVAAPSLQVVKAEGKSYADPTAQPSFIWPHERAPELSADIMVIALGAVDMTDYRATGKVLGLPRFGKGRPYFITGNETLAMESGTPLSMAWASRNLAPELAKAAYLSGQK